MMNKFKLIADMARGRRVRDPMVAVSVSSVKLSGGHAVVSLSRLNIAVSVAAIVWAAA